MSFFNKRMSGAPSGEVLRAFGVRGEVTHLQGGQGNVFACEDVVFKPAGDPTEATWLAQTQQNLPQRGFRLARPLTSVAGSFVVGGWTAWSRLPGEHRLHGAPWPLVVTLCARFHEALEHVPRPAFLDRRHDNFARADRIAWGELEVPLVPEIRAVIESLRSRMQPSRERQQVIHADLAGNILFAEDCEPAVIDLSPYWRPASYAMALTIVDAVLWYGGSLDLLAELSRFDDARQLVARALTFRLAIEGLFALDDPGPFWSATISRDLASAQPLLQYVEA